MTPKELAALHPKLYHVTEPDAWPMIERHGLLSTAAILELFEIDESTRKSLTERCRPAAVPLSHPKHGQLIINDNKPMSENALRKCLDDNLVPEDWLRILSHRIFFWSTEEGLSRFLGARMNRNRNRLVLTIDTCSLVAAYHQQVEICPINSGSTIRKPARRGLDTFTPLSEMSYQEWQKKRGKRDRIREVTVLGKIPDLGNFVLDKKVSVSPTG